MSTAAARTRQARLLLRPTLRALRWQPLPVAVLAAVLLLWWRDPARADPPAVLWEVRVVGVLLAAGVAGAFDDHTRATLSAVPAPLRFRSGLRVLLVVAPAAAAWAVLVSWVDARVAGALPSLALTLEAATVTAVVVAFVASLAVRPGLPDPGVAAGPVLAGFVFGVPGLPAPVALTTLPGPGWESAHLRWTAVLVVSVAVLAVAVRDPAASLRRQRQGSEDPPSELLVTDDLDVRVVDGEAPAGQPHHRAVGHP